MASLGRRLSSTSGGNNFDQNWHHLYSTSAGQKDLSNDTQIRVLGLMAPEICTKMLKKLRRKLRAKFPVTTRGFSMVKLFSMTLSSRSFFNCKQALWKVKEKKRKGEKGKGTKEIKKKIEKRKHVCHFLPHKLKIVISAHARAKMS